MRELELPFKTPAVREASINLPRDQNQLIVRLTDATWVAAATEAGEVVREHNPREIVAFILPPGTYTVRTDGVIQDVTFEVVEVPPSLFDRLQPQQPAVLVLSSNAPDKHVVDGVGEIRADGRSHCRIQIQKASLDGSPLTGEEDNDELFLRTTGGILLHESREEKIRSLRLHQGQGAFRLRSEANPKIVTISVFGKGQELFKNEIQIEFV